VINQAADGPEFIVNLVVRALRQALTDNPALKLTQLQP
jgi:hypothetical protein